ncbi:glycosyltransferase [Nanoarchaeota archaeon]
MNDIMRIVLWIVYLISLYFAVFWFLVFLDEEPREKKKPLKKQPLVSVIIPAYNEESRIKKTILSVLKLDYPREKLQTVVINDGSSDKTRQVVEQVIKANKGFDIVLLNQENKGKGAALNQGLRISKGEFFICLDADSHVRKDALNKMLPHFAEEDVAAVLPVLKVRKPKNLLQKMQWFEYIINMFYKELMGKLDCIHVAPGPFSVYRKSILVKIGGFDEDGNLTEDLEIALRLQKNHYRIIQLLDTEVYTAAPDTLKALYKQRNRWYKGAIHNAINYRKLLFNKKYGDFGLIQMPTILVSGIIAIVMILSIAYYAISPYIRNFNKLRFIDFDFITLVKTFSLNFHFLELNYMFIMIAGVMLFVSILILKKSHISTNERVFKYGAYPLILYLFFYFFVLGPMWVGIAVDFLLRKKKQRW